MDQEIENLLDRIAAGESNINRIRLEIASLIARRIQAARESFERGNGSTLPKLLQPLQITSQPEIATQQHGCDSPF